MATFPGIVQAIVLIVALLLLNAAIGTGAAVTLIAAGLAGEAGLVAVIGIANLASFGIVIWWSVRHVRVPPAQVLPFSPIPALAYLPLVLSLLGCGILASESDNLLRYLLPMPEKIASMFESIAKGGGASFVTVVLIAPVTEELLFRGVILGAFANRYRPWTAITVSALLFGLMHLNPYQFFGAFALGLVLGWLRLRTRSLWPCVIGHAVFNAHGIIIARLLPFTIPGYNPNTLDMSQVVFQPLWFDLSGLIVTVAGLWWLDHLLHRESRTMRPSR